MLLGIGLNWQDNNGIKQGKARQGKRKKRLTASCTTEKRLPIG
jgi:hypothetical protein